MAHIKRFLSYLILIVVASHIEEHRIWLYVVLEQTEGHEEGETERGNLIQITQSQKDTNEVRGEMRACAHVRESETFHALQVKMIFFGKHLEPFSSLPKCCPTIALIFFPFVRQMPYKFI